MADTRPEPGREDAAEAGRKPFLLRLPAPLLDELRRWADDELRSLNGHLEWLLRDAVRRHRRGDERRPPPSAAGDAPAR